MPMTKAAVKAMDTITDFVNKATGKDITKFCVGGASKVKKNISSIVYTNLKNENWKNEVF